MYAPISTCHGSPAWIAAEDVIKRAQKALGPVWNRTNHEGQIVECRAILLTDILRQAPTSPATPLEWWRAVQTAFVDTLTPVG